MSAKQTIFPMVPSLFRFFPHGQSSLELSELPPPTARRPDELCVIRCMHTEAINDAPAMSLIQTGDQTGGRPSLGAWVAFGLGSHNDNLPTLFALVSKN